MNFLKNLFLKLFCRSNNTSTPNPPEAPPIPEKHWSSAIDAVIDSNRLSEVNRTCEIILANKHRYEAIEKILKIPWWFVAGLHYRESSLLFSGVLHNGERILGTGKKTKLVPKGRGPFETWEESAIDALEMKAYHKITDWNLVDACYYAEKYNGMGYRKKVGDSGKVEFSPYVAAGTSLHDETSKYVSDGRYDPSAKEKQLGVLAIWKGLKVF